MPTENRSSNTEIVSVPRELAERIQQRLDHAASAFKGAKPERDELRSLLAQPAEQHQGEPVAWIFRELPEAPLQVTDRWDVAKHLPLEVTAVYTHADPGEVERLNLEIEKLRLSLTLNDDALIQDGCVRIENRSLRAQLAGRDALLRDKSGDLIRMAAHLISAPLFALQDLQDEDKKMTRARVDHAVDVADARLKDAAYGLRRIADALSANAEPSAPATCIWTYNENSFAWDTTCNESFLLMEDGPKENCMKFCCYCSKPIIQAPHEAES